jgi:CIC family chloride channel protein
MPLYILLGIICGVFGVYFQKGILFSLDFYKNQLRKLPPWGFGAVAGLLTGLVGLWVPEAIGGGHTTLEGTLAQAYIWWMIPIFFLFKFLLTLVAYGSGIPGGIFAPALVLGALLGATLGNIANMIAPELNLNPATFAFVGMGAFFTGISRAPITSIVMLFELTGNYNLVLPLMFGCIVANVTAEKFHSGSIYENLLKRDGVELDENAAQPYLQRFQIEQAMNQKVETVTVKHSLHGMIELFKRSHHTGFPVLDENQKLVGIVTKDDINEAIDQRMDGSTLIGEFMTSDLITVFPKDSLQIAVLKFYEYKIGRLLVVDPNAPSKLLGLITRSDIINYEAYEELHYN